MKIRTGVILSAMLLGACASTGTEVTDKQLAGFHPGQTTEAELIARLGPPQIVSEGAGGAKKDIYLYSRATTRGSTFIPVVDLLAGGADTKTSRVTFEFDTAGVLKGWTTSANDNGMNTGLLNQPK